MTDVHEEITATQIVDTVPTMNGVLHRSSQFAVVPQNCSNNIFSETDILAHRYLRCTSTS